MNILNRVEESKEINIEEINNKIIELDKMK